MSEMPYNHLHVEFALALSAKISPAIRFTCVFLQDQGRVRKLMVRRTVPAIVHQAALLRRLPTGCAIYTYMVL